MQSQHHINTSLGLDYNVTECINGNISKERMSQSKQKLVCLGNRKISF